MYLSLPAVEVLIYKQVWTFPAWEGFKVFIKKKVYNHEVMGYSGEFYLFMWARKLEGNSEKSVLKDIRDNSILSAVTSNLVAVVLVALIIYSGQVESNKYLGDKVLVALIIYSGQVEISELLGDVNWVYLLTGIFIAMIVVILIIQFRRYLFDLSPRKAARILLLYLTRFIVHHGLMVLSWALEIGR